MCGSIRNWLIPFFFWLFFQGPRGSIASGNVTLESMVIFKSHELINRKPTIYFLCQGETKTYLPDVKEVKHVYSFKGEESWQPLTTLAGRKCKRCGLYEKDKFTSDDTYDEWELCPEDFSPAPEGRYKHHKDKEFNATFLCSECNPSDSGSAGTTTKSGSPMASDKRGYKTKLGVLVFSIVFIIVLAIAIFLYRVWQKKKREEQQARFLKLFEDDDDLEIELGLRD